MPKVTVNTVNQDKSLSVKKSYNRVHHWRTICSLEKLQG